MDKNKKLILNVDSEEAAKSFFNEVQNIGIAFKLNKQVRSKKSNTEDLKNSLLEDLNSDGISTEDLLKQFCTDILPDCSNFSSSNFMGFPDAGNSIASIGGAIMADFLQQNLINQSFCAPSATFIEIATIQWIRQAVGYPNQKIENIWDVGGIVTPGGTSSNTIAMMLARENKAPGTLESGVKDPKNFKVIVPENIGHYSVKSAQRWLGCGDNLIEVKTNKFRYDLNALEKTLKENAGAVMAVVAYAGDSRTMTVEHLDKVATLVKKIDPKVWLHADACHGFSLGFSNKLRSKINGIELFDSISTDPHKVMLIPYTLSVLLVKNPENFKSITSLSDLIMQEDFAFGQITPFIGSKPWSSLKLWFMMKNFGWSGLDELITTRHEIAVTFAELVKKRKSLILLNDVDINSVIFMYQKDESIDINEINEINKHIHKEVISKGKFHLHQFSVPDPGVLKKGSMIYPLRFMSGNPNLTTEDMENLLDYIEDIGRSKDI